jgi:Flp pilus assembly protein TadG
MQGRIHHLYSDEQGMAFVYVGLGFMGFLAATTLAIDVGMFMAARAQAQNAADAGALARVVGQV